MSFSESLTVRILGDSSGLRSELEEASRLLGDLQQRLARATSGGELLASAFSRLSGGLRPLQQVSAQLERITQQARTLSSTQVALNVQPALASLQQLVGAAQGAAQALRAVSLAGGMRGAPAAGLAGGTGGGPVRRLAAGGLVLGPAGVDRVPAQLTAGEYVVPRSVVAAVGVAALQRMESQATRYSHATASTAASLPTAVTTGATAVRELRVLADRLTSTPAAELMHQDFTRDMVGPHKRHWPRELDPLGRASETPPPGRALVSLPNAPSRRSLRAAPPPPWSPPPTHNHFGGIAIHVREASDVQQVLDGLRREGIGQRRRWG